MDPIFDMAVMYFCYFLNTLIFIRVIVSWLPVNRDGAIVNLLYTLTEPILAPTRYLLNKSPLGGKGMMLDLSPIFSFLFIYAAEVILVGLF